ESSAYDAGLALLNAGVSVLPVIGKRPAVFNWSRFQAEAMNAPDWMEATYGNNSIGVAAIAGAVSGNLVIIDLDGLPAMKSFVGRFPDLTESLCVGSGSGNGMHIYLRVDNMPPNRRKNGVEIRGEGCYTVCPPSIHPVTGNRYQLLHDAPILQFNNINPVLRWLNPEKPVPNTEVNDLRPSGGNDAWVTAALLREITNLRLASEGNVNNTLNAVSYRLARIAANPDSGLIPSDVQSTILASIPDYIAREGERAARNTMMSGWRAGWAKPAHIPQAQYGRDNQ
ncbi:MAG: bifunctional DNA primase/polymerase, partial [Chloroflexota bacterium]